MLYCPILYPHRKTADGSYISFCPACFAPIARSKVETELAEQDKRHVCNSSFLADRGCLGRVNQMGDESALSRPT